MKRGKFETKRFFGLLLAIVMVFSLAPQGVLAVEEPITEVEGGELVEVVDPVDPAAPTDPVTPEVDSTDPVDPTPVTYTVKFYVGADKVDEKTATENEAMATLPADPTAEEGYSFVGWRDRNETGSAVIDNLAGMTVTKDMELEAVFVVSPKAIQETFRKLIDGITDTEVMGDTLDGAYTSYTVSFDTGNSSTADFTRQSSTETGLVAEPGAPAIPSGQRSFRGWFTQAQNGERFDFDTEITGDITLYAQFSDDYMVQFLDANGKVVSSQEVGRWNYASAIEWQWVTPAGKTFSHWSREANGTAFNFTSTRPSQVATNGSLILHPVFTESVEVIFISEGSYVAPKTVAKGTQLRNVGVANPERVGYDFSHWSLEAGGAAYGNNTAINEDITLYAVWTPARNTPYTVVYWVEKPGIPVGTAVGEDDYILLGSRTWTGTTGAVVSAPTSTNMPEGYASYVESAAVRYDQNVTISAAGNTVVNAYFNRKVFTITFNLVDSSGNGNNENTTLVMNNATYRGNSSTRYSLQAKFEGNISTTWPLNATYHNNNRKFTGWTVSGDDILGNGTTWLSKRLVLSHDMVPSNGSGYTVRARWSTDTNSYNLYYYKESLEGRVDGAVSYGGKWYVEMAEYTQTNVAAPGSFSAKDIAGLTHVDTDSSGYTYKFYYSVDSLKLTFNGTGGQRNNQNQYVIDGMYEGQDLDSYSNDNAEGFVRNGYTFTGWYSEPNCSEASKVDFSTLKMPNSALILYAGWQGSTHTVTFYSDNTAATAVGTQTFGDEGGSLDYSSDELIAAGWGLNSQHEGIGQLIGWRHNPSDLTTTDGTTAKVNWNEGAPVGTDLNLYPVFQTEDFTVTYEMGTATGGNVPVDGTKYSLNASAVVLGNSGSLVKGTQVFVGWKVVDSQTGIAGGSTYYPNTYLKITGNMKLQPYFVDASETTTLTYHANFSGAVPATDIYTVEPGDVTAADYANLNLAEIPAGARFTGWAETSTGAVVYGVGDPVPVSMDGKDLYAVWDYDEVNYTVDFSVSPTGQGHMLDVGGTQHATWEYEVPEGTPWNDSDIVIPEPKAATGYYFVGWDNDPDPDDYAANNTPVNEPLSFVAKFAEKITVDLSLSAVVSIEDSGKVYGENDPTIDESLVTLNLPTGADPDHFEITNVVRAPGEDVDTYGITADITVKEEFAKMYDVINEPTPGTFTITPATLTVTAGDYSIAFLDPAPDYDLYTITGFVTGDNESIITGAPALTGEYVQGDLADEYDTYAAEGTLVDTSGNYVFEYAEGVLTVGKKTVEQGGGDDEDYETADVWLNNGTKVYGTNDPDLKDYIDWKNLNKDHFDIVSVSRDVGEDVASYPMTAVIAPKTAYAESYELTGSLTATFTITKAALDVYITNQLVDMNEPAPHPLPYTIDPGQFKFTDTEASILGSDWSDGIATDYVAGDPVIAAGYPIEYRGDKLAHQNYDIVIHDGTLYVETADIKQGGGDDDDEDYETADVWLNDGTKVYGTNDPDLKDYIDWRNLNKDHFDLTLTTATRDVGEDVGPYPMTATITPKDEYAESYTFSGEMVATFTITPATLVVRADDKTVVFGDDAPEYTYSIEGFVNGDDADNNDITGAPELTGTYSQWDPIGSYDIDAAEGTLASGNYVFEYEKGTLTVTANETPITITAASGSKQFDGAALVNPNYTPSGVPENLELTAVVEGSQTIVGSSDNEVVSHQILMDGIDVSAGFTNVTYVPGTLEVTPNTTPIIITAASDAKIFDGAALTNPNYGVATTLTGAGITATVEGSQTEAGSSANEVASHQVMLNGQNVTAYYTNVSYVPGTLTVAPEGTQILIMAASDSKVFDGTALTNNAHTIITDLQDVSVSATINGSQTAVGSSQNTVASHTVMKNGQDVTGNYSNVVYVHGTLVVTPAAAPVPVTPAPIIPAAVTPADDPADPDDPDDTVVIPEEPTPADDGADDEEEAAAAPVVDIDDNDTPTDAGQKHWALWNLILTIITGVIMLVILIGYFVGKKRKEEEDDPYQRQAREDGQESEEELKRRGIIRLLTIIPTIVAIIVFILTEDMRLPMQMTDEWTIWMAVIAIVQVVVAVFTKKKRVTPEDDEMDKATPQNF